jgi:hypothetical protein
MAKTVEKALNLGKLWNVQFKMSQEIKISLHFRFKVADQIY